MHTGVFEGHYIELKEMLRKSEIAHKETPGRPEPVSQASDLAGECLKEWPVLNPSTA